MPRSPLSRRSGVARLLIVGGSGRLGSMMRRAWPLAGAGVVPIWQARRQSDFAGLGGPDVVFDPLAAPEAFQAAAQGADAVLMLAAPMPGGAADWAQGTDLALAAVAAAAGRPVFVASSAAVYGAPTGPAPFGEDDPPVPVSDYGRAKAAMEAALADHPGVTVLRIGNVAGADALLGFAPEGVPRRLHILSDGIGPRRSYIGPQALVRALARGVRLSVFAEQAKLPARLNLALPGVVPMEALLRAAGADWVAEPAPDSVIPRVELDVTRAIALGLVPEDPASAARIVADLRALEGTA
ncbi:hypothetical protein CKO11_08940 [Rhodobacter sp. TJ_12]|uniref:NAD-dependent epimerase/dehydratase family protein n=1 Tax=Rhodobacter sp. TJ_12 TaxID=2029399 RepID=UPI001CBB1B87|nr:NAD(P)-dependent oxidoreductase [Rhodobacter sp. TJ_12]MBZ4022581.1 hypothetical protein [Rhodobacter sp. TJ_12]